MNLIALDLGLARFGYAFAIGGQEWAGSQVLKEKFRDPAGVRYMRFRAWWQKVSHAIPEAFVVYEAPFMGTKKKGRGHYWAVRALFGLETRVEEFCAERDWPHRKVHVATVKRFATEGMERPCLRCLGTGLTTKRHVAHKACSGTGLLTSGYGRASKEDVAAGVLEKWGYDAKDHDECDAYALLQYAKQHAEALTAEAAERAARATRVHQTSICSDCGLAWQVRADGCLRMHRKLDGSLCGGSGRKVA